MVSNRSWLGSCLTGFSNRGVTMDETLILLSRLFSLVLALLILQASAKSLIYRHRKKLPIWLDIICFIAGLYWIGYFLTVLTDPSSDWLSNIWAVNIMRPGYIITASALYSFLRGRVTTSVIEDIVRNGNNDNAKLLG